MAYVEENIQCSEVPSNMRASQNLVKQLSKLLVAHVVLCLILIYLLYRRYKAEKLELEERLILSELGCGILRTYEVESDRTWNFLVRQNTNNRQP